MKHSHHGKGMDSRRVLTGLLWAGLGFALMTAASAAVLNHAGPAHPSPGEPIESVYFDRSESHPSYSEHSPTLNPLRQEMQQLDQAFREVYSAVVLSDGVRVRKALAPLEGSLEHTHQALDSGSIRLPRNAG
ncbi:MAG TPA: hypothetical protein V6D23_12870, partial [Candidatus Obscuribacterales bacterium]